jgi:hypothetical protein
MTEDIAHRIRALEDARYQAMLDGNISALDELCSQDLIYSHSRGEYDDKRSYLEKVSSGVFIYHEISHPVDRILIVSDAALVTGQMTARVSVIGEMRTINNRYLAVWFRQDGNWKLVAYQPTPIVDG